MKILDKYGYTNKKDFKMKYFTMVVLLVSSMSAVADRDDHQYGPQWQGQGRSHSYQKQYINQGQYYNYNNQDWSARQWNNNQPQPRYYYQPLVIPPQSYYYNNRGGVMIQLPGFSLFLNQ